MTEPEREGRMITWRIRAAPASELCPEPSEEYLAAAFYNPYELTVMAGLKAQLDGPRRVEAMNSIDTLHEAKVLLGAVIEPPPAPPPDEDEIRAALDELRADKPGPVVSGKYFGKNPTPTERASGVQIEIDNEGLLRKGGAGHMMLAAFAGGDRMTAYDGSARAEGGYHDIRREAERLMRRGFLAKAGKLPNHAPRGRKEVDAYVITPAGLSELDRLRD